MAKINLLPWREELRKEKQQQFFAIMGITALIAAGIWGVIHFYHTQLIEYQQERNAFMEAEIAKLDKKIEEIKKLEKEKERLLARMRAIEQLQGNRPLIVRFFDEIVANIPEGMSLTKITQKKNKFTLYGIAQSNARVSGFMRALEKSKWLANPDLDIIRAGKGSGKGKGGAAEVYDFTLRIKQVIPKAEDEEGEGGEEE